jgi:hypothetical protein
MKLKDHRIVTGLCAGALLLVLGGSLWAFFVLHVIGGQSFILHFNDVDGITNVGGLGTIIFMGIFGVLVSLMNFIVALEFDSRGPFLGKFLAAMTLVFAILLFIGFASIINVNV